jgi:hypothetical protein
MPEPASLNELVLRAEGNLAALLALWDGPMENGVAAALNVALVDRVARDLIGLGAPTAAIEVLTRAQRRFSDEPALQHLEALALARLGAADRAHALLDALLAHSPLSDSLKVESLGLRGRLCKEAAFSLKSGAARDAQLKQSLNAYLSGFDLTGSAWCGINAALLLLELGRVEAGRAQAASIEKRVLADQRGAAHHSASERLWSSAILGDCALIRGDVAAAQTWYRTTHLLGSAQHRLADIASTRRQALRIAERLALDRDAVLAALPRPKVLLFSGHRFDFLIERRPAPRLPIAWSEALEADLAAWLRDAHFMRDGELGAAVGSLSVGADLLFVEALIQRQCEIHLVLPIEAKAYLATTCAAHGSAFRARLEAALSRASGITIASPQAATARVRDFQLTNELIAGIARLRAQRLDGVLEGVAVWDGHASEHRGGTWDALRMWRGLAIDAGALKPRAPDAEPQWVNAVGALPPLNDARAQAFLFADFSGFSGLPDEALPDFVERALGGIASLLGVANAAARGPLTQNTWGDGVFLAFSRPAHAAAFALELNAWLHTEQAHWATGALKNLRARISLHAGNATRARDPLTGLESFWGAHVSFAARLEPATPVGVIYASETFAALLEIDAPNRVKMEYVGELEWAKAAGRWPTWRLLGDQHAQPQP